MTADVNECVMGTDMCEGNCHNTVGSYTCSCSTGYTLGVDRQSCTGRFCLTGQDIPIKFNEAGNLIKPRGVGGDSRNYKLTLFFTDINECLSSSGNRCQQLCVNTPGTYTCQCNTGFTLAADGRTCTGWNIF